MLVVMSSSATDSQVKRISYTGGLGGTDVNTSNPYG